MLDAPAERTTIEQLSIQEARALAVMASRLDRRPCPTREPTTQKARLLETIRALGCVQLDTISVVSRSHETVLWSRLGPYDPALLASLHYPDGLITEYWAHAAAIIPVEAFPYFRDAMDAYDPRFRREPCLAGSFLGLEPHDLLSYGRQHLLPLRQP